MHTHHHPYLFTLHTHHHPYPFTFHTHPYPFTLFLPGTPFQDYLPTSQLRLPNPLALDQQGSIVYQNGPPSPAERA